MTDKEINDLVLAVEICIERFGDRTVCEGDERKRLYGLYYCRYAYYIGVFQDEPYAKFEQIAEVCRELSSYAIGMTDRLPIYESLKRKSNYGK